jgi:ATP-binding cassette subfamily C (CFTR/MRP) protein 1
VQVLVLDAGTVKEFAAPAALLKDKQSIFYGMAKNAGLVD